MKKLFIFVGALLLGVGAFGIRGNKAARVSASLTDEQALQMKAMMNSYIDAWGQYTKKSQIYLDTSAEDFATYFHAGHTVQERTTYYDDGVLLMGNLDGGFNLINSGYANSGENMVHFTSNDGVNAINLEDRRYVDYTVEGKQMSDYFFDLHDLVNSIQAGDWGYNDGTYYHDIGTLTLNENGDYSDPLLKKFQYFAAPMLLQTAQHYLSFKSITVNQHDGYLHICIYLSESDSGKVTSGSNLLAEAMVYAGLMQPGYYLVGNYNGDEYDWQPRSGMLLTKPAEGTDRGVLDDAMIRAGKYQVLQLKADGKTAWFHNVPDINDYAYAEMDGNDIHIKYGGTYDIYLNEAGNLYIFRVDHKTATITFDFTNSPLASWNPAAENFALHIYTNENAELGTWGGDDEKMNNNAGTYSYTFDFNGSVTGVWFYFYQSGICKQSENIIGDLTIENGGSYTVTLGTIGWNGNTMTSGVTLS